MQVTLNEMIGLAVRHVDTAPDILPRVHFRVCPHPTGHVVACYRPMLFLVLQGAKQMVVGDQVMRYDPSCHFVGSLALIGSGRILEASPDRPFVTVSLELDVESLAALLPELPPRMDFPTRGFALAPTTPALLDPLCRLLRLLDKPDDAAVLAPMFEREILYRLLRGPQGQVLYQLARTDSRLSQIRQAIGWISTHYDQPLRIEQLARMTGMSVASFHRHFKTATGTSPLSYQKSLRLQHARRQLLATKDATRVGYSVGYESLSQFSREYARMFGQPPMRDARRVLGGLSRLSS